MGHSPGSSSIASIPHSAVAVAALTRARKINERPLVGTSLRGTETQPNRPGNQSPTPSQGSLNQAFDVAVTRPANAAISSPAPHTHPLCAHRDVLPPGRGNSAQRACVCGSAWAVAGIAGCTQTPRESPPILRWAPRRAVLSSESADRAPRNRDSFIQLCHARRDRLRCAPPSVEHNVHPRHINRSTTTLPWAAGCARTARSGHAAVPSHCLAEYRNSWIRVGARGRLAHAVQAAQPFKLPPPRHAVRALFGRTNASSETADSRRSHSSATGHGIGPGRPVRSVGKDAKPRSRTSGGQTSGTKSPTAARGHPPLATAGRVDQKIFTLITKRPSPPGMIRPKCDGAQAMIT